MDYSVKPDYKQCVSIVTQSALKQMIKPVRYCAPIRFDYSLQTGCCYY